MRWTLALSAVALLTLIDTAARAEDLGAEVRLLLQHNCAECHSAGAARGGFDFVLDRDKLLARGQVVAARPDESPLVRRVRSGEMPPSKQPRLTDEEVALIVRWVKDGAPAFEKATPATILAQDQVQRLIAEDLEKLDPRARRFQRYLTLAHLPTEERAKHAQAIEKLVNSLTWQPKMVRVAWVDPAHAVARIDLRKVKWTSRAWDRLVVNYPYRAPEPTPALKALAQVTGAEQPYLRGDWFLVTASRPPAYYDLLQLPQTDRTLERQLMVDVLQDIADDAAIRAGFNNSGVSRNNRVLERHDAMHGAYWRSYDFTDNTDRQNVFKRPLGPSPGESAFVPAGGEIIFHLPNGLLGFMLVDGAGRRINKGPVEIVSDPKRPDKLVEAGVSCFSCHHTGFLPKEDQVRPHVQKNQGSFPREDRDSILALYVPPEKFKKAMDADIARYEKALGELGIKAGEPEPVITAVLRYEANVDLVEAAAEAGLPAEEFARKLQDSVELKRTLGPLLAKGGTVQRQVFEEQFPELARRLNLFGGTVGTPILAANAFAGHEDTVRAVAFSGDGARAISGGADRTVRVWDAKTGKQLFLGEGHRDDVLCVALSGDGTLALTGSADRTVRLWDVAKGREVKSFTGHTDRVRAVAISADGMRGVSAGADKTVRVWNLATGKEIIACTGHTGTVTSVALSADGKRVLSGSLDRTVRLWDAETGNELAKLTGHTGEVHAVALSPDGKRAASGGNDRAVRVWDLQKKQEERTFSGHENAVVHVAFTGNGKWLTSVVSLYRNRDQIFRSWSIENGTERKGWKGADVERVECGAVAPGGKALLLGGSESRLRLVNLSND